jgi:hypothetical protein
MNRPTFKRTATAQKFLCADKHTFLSGIQGKTNDAK